MGYSSKGDSDEAPFATPATVRVRDQTVQDQLIRFHDRRLVVLAESLVGGSNTHPSSSAPPSLPTPRYARETDGHGALRLAGAPPQQLAVGCTRTSGVGSSLTRRPRVPYVLDCRDRPADRRGRCRRHDASAVC